VRAVLSVPTLNGVLTATLDGTMMLWDTLDMLSASKNAEKKKPRKVYKGHRTGIIAIAYSPSLKVTYLNYMLIYILLYIRYRLLIWSKLVTCRLCSNLLT
jgi:hypothetical protein